MAQIQVGFNSTTGEITVNPPRLRVNPGTHTLTWVPNNGIEISYVGFATPVGAGNSISIPEAESSGSWKAQNVNDLGTGQVPVFFKYTVWVKVTVAGTSTVIGRDPEIVNDPPSGGADEDDGNPGGGG